MGITLTLYNTFGTRVQRPVIDHLHAIATKRKIALLEERLLSEGNPSHVLHIHAQANTVSDAVDALATLRTWMQYVARGNEIDLTVRLRQPTVLVELVRPVTGRFVTARALDSIAEALLLLNSRSLLVHVTRLLLTPATPHDDVVAYSTTRPGYLLDLATGVIERAPSAFDVPLI